MKKQIFEAWAKYLLTSGRITEEHYNRLTAIILKNSKDGD